MCCAASSWLDLNSDHYCCGCRHSDLCLIHSAVTHESEHMLVLHLMTCHLVQSIEQAQIQGCNQGQLPIVALFRRQWNIIVLLFSSKPQGLLQWPLALQFHARSNLKFLQSLAMEATEEFYPLLSEVGHKSCSFKLISIFTYVITHPPVINRSVNENHSSSVFSHTIEGGIFATSSVTKFSRQWLFLRRLTVYWP